MSDELIKKLKEYPAFAEFTEYMVAKIEEFDSTSGLDEMTNEQAGEEVRARSKARNKLYEILSPLVEPAEKKQPSKEQIGFAKAKFGL
jgi:hypothetical protein